MFVAYNVKASNLNLNSCLKTVDIDQASLLKEFGASSNEEQILSIKGEVTRFVDDGCNLDNVDKFWLNGGEARSITIQMVPNISTEGLCKSKFISFNDWPGYKNHEEGFFISDHKDCLSLPINQYTEIHSPIPDESIDQLLSSVELAKAHLKESENIDVEGMRVLALGLRKYDDFTSFYLWFGFPKNSIWYEVPVRLSYSGGSTTFYKVSKWIE